MNWIKMRSELATDPDVIEIARVTGQDEFGVVGRLHAVWAWLDQHSEDGTEVRVSGAFIDRMTACPKFSEALRSVGWLSGDDGSLCFPGYSEHNGQTAKARGLSQKRMVRQRNNRDARSVTTVTVGASPEKRREEKSISSTHTERAEPEVEPTRKGEIPNLAQFTTECALYMIPAWYAEKKFTDFEAKGWMSGSTQVVWKNAIKGWVKRDFENDGRPLHPPKPSERRPGAATPPEQRTYTDRKL